MERLLKWSAAARCYRDTFKHNKYTLTHFRPLGAADLFYLVKQWSAEASLLASLLANMLHPPVKPKHSSFQYLDS